ncbi:Short C-terminal domain-containing protein [Paenibacillus tianmuensis]|uniref:Short C-terminal domain-containing protein n=1 Tax=Paenibacillus tianmuensis TaxID=624147 RepID=A0A1G4RMF9_9BACL|nr:SHOCT domain-containing protein [Paenibacillus tianmuensis]SCW57359.1 Short C-terminal domain-containing protein [Paenibacillus tianmuensis]
MYLGFGGIFGILAFIVFFIAIAHGGVAWLLLIGFGVASWYCYKKHKELEEEKMEQKRQITDERLVNIPNYKSTQRYTSQSGDVTLSIDENSKQISFVNTNFYHKDKLYKYSDILKSEILTDGISVTSTNRGSQLGGALLGGLLAGGVGALMGGLSGSTTSQEKVKKIELNVIVNDTANPIHKIAFLDSDFTSYAKDSHEYKDAYNTAYHCHQLIGVLIRQADEEDKQKETLAISNNPHENVSVADELRKLAQLRNDGILSGDEFESQKKKLIG